MTIRRHLFIRHSFELRHSDFVISSFCLEFRYLDFEFLAIA